VSGSAAEAKRHVRRELRERLARITPREREAWSAAACARVVESAPYRRARTIMGYLPLHDECDVTPVLRAALDAGRRLCLPRAAWDDRSLVPAGVESLEAGAFVTGRHGIFEPGPGSPELAAAEVDLVLVPGLGFDEGCWRIGRGAGFYDRFLARLRRDCAQWAAAFEAQIVPGTDGLPRDAWDRPIDAVATESRLIVRGRG